MINNKISLFLDNVNTLKKVKGTWGSDIFIKCAALTLTMKNKKAELGIGSNYNVYININNEEDKKIVINMLKLNDKIIDKKDNYNEKVEYNGLEIEIYFDNSKNLKEQEEKLIKEKELLEKSIERREKLLSNENYINKAPSNIVEKEKEDLRKEKELLNNLLNKFTK